MRIHCHTVSEGRSTRVPRHQAVEAVYATAFLRTSWPCCWSGRPRSLKSSTARVRGTARNSTRRSSRGRRAGRRRSEWQRPWAPRTDAVARSRPPEPRSARSWSSSATATRSPYRWHPATGTCCGSGLRPATDAATPAFTSASARSRARSSESIVQNTCKEERSLTPTRSSREACSSRRRRHG